MRQPWRDIYLNIKWAWQDLRDKLWGVSETVWRLGVLIAGLNAVGWGGYALLILARKTGVS